MTPQTIFYKHDIYPIIHYINKNHKNIFRKDLEYIKDNDWMQYPESKNITGNYLIYPLYMYSIVSNKRADKCIKSFNLIQTIPNIKSFAFVKLDANSSINSPDNYNGLTTTTLRCLLIMYAPDADTVNNCCITVNNHIQKIISGKLYIYDSCHNHIIDNKTKYPMYAILIDVDKPKSISSKKINNDYTNEIYEFINNLN